jgi:membrane fusion protein, peptide pheromone/bacteriocin exporter
VPNEKFHSSEDIRDSIESLQSVHGRERPIIYWTFLLVVLIAVVALPLIKVDVSVGAMGQVRPAIERMSVYPAVTGIIKELRVVENQQVRKGDVLLTLDTISLDARLKQNRLQHEENTRALHDLSLLLKSPALVAPSSSEAIGNYAKFTSDAFIFELPKQFQSAQIIREHALFLSDLQRLLLQRSKAVQDFKRVELLHNNNVISGQDYDQQRYEVESSERALDLAIQQAVGKWQASKVERELKEADFESEATQLEQEKDFYTVRAPVDGTAIGFNGLHSGLFIPQSQSIGEISPVGGLQADVYINPKDIGFIHEGQLVKIQVDAFPHTEWGMLRGRVREISQDYVQYGQQIAFKALVDLDGTSLKSASGVKVELRRGMTVNARFIVRERTLFRLLFSNMSESFDPRIKQAE